MNKENIKYSLQNLRIRKSRSFLTILSIFVGITTIFIFVSFGLGLYHYVESFTTTGAADKFMVMGKGSGAPGMNDVVLNDDDVDTIEKTNGVIEAYGMYFGAIAVEQGSSRRYTFGAGFDPKANAVMFESFGIYIDKGRKLNDADKDKVTVGYNYQVPNRIFPKAYKVNDKIEINGEKFRIAGFYEEIGNPQDDSQVYMTKETFLRLFPDTENYGMIYGRAEVDDIGEIVLRVEKELRKDRGEEEGKEEFYVSSFLDQMEAFSSALNVIVGFIILIALISVAVSAVNTANTMVTSVLERTREIGILKAIGAKNSGIFNIFLFESAVLGFVAGIIGVLIGFIITAMIGAGLRAAGWSFLAPLYSFSLFFGCVSFATIVGAISGVAPAVNASRKKPVDALRYE